MAYYTISQTIVSKPLFRITSSRSIKSTGLLNHQLTKLIILLFYHLHNSIAIKVDGFSEYTGVAGNPLLLPCNTSNGALWTSQVTMILFYKGTNGKPLFTMDRRNDQRNITLPISSSSSIIHYNNYSRSRAKPTILPHRASLISSNSFYYDQALNTPVYFIESLRESDEGEYRCRIDYKQSRTRNYVIKLNVIVPPKENIIMTSDGQVLDKIAGPIEENDDLSLVCEAFAKPAPSVVWYFDDILIDDSYFSEQRGLSRNELQLTNLNRSRLNSQLTCRSQNSNLTKATQTTIALDFILKPLQIKIIVDNKRLESGQEVTFQCIVYGARPQPSISWNLVDADDLPSDLINNNQDNFIENELSSGSSYFDWYSKQDYSSSISDKNQLIKNSTNFKTNSKLTDRSDRFRSSNSNRIKFNSTLSNSKLTNSFISDSNTAGISFETAKKTAITQVLSESENIHSSQIRFRLNENYNNKQLICRAENFRLKGSQQNSAVLQENFLLQVQYKPIVKLKLGASLHADRLRENNDLYLDCTTSSNPPSTSVRFLKDGQSIQPETGVLIANQTLVLQQVKRRFRGLYTCESDNSVGRSQSNELYLRIQYAPVCALNIVQTKSVPRNGQVELACEVYSDPAVTSFRWYLNNSSETIEITSNTAIFNQTLLRSIITQSSLSSSSINKTNNFYKMHHFYPQLPTSFNKNQNLSLNLDSSSQKSDLFNYNSNKVHEDDGQLYISIGRFSPSSRFDFGTVFCKAENQIDRQQEPCTFQLLPVGPPSRLENCHISNHSLTSLVVFCTNEQQLTSHSNQLNNQLNNQISNKQQFNQQFNNQINSQQIAHHIHPSNLLYTSQQQSNDIARRNLYMAIIYEVNNEQFVLNLTRKQPYFVLNTLKPATQYTVLLYAINEQGKSPVNRLHTATLGPPEKRQMSSDLNDETASDFSLLSLRQRWLTAISGSFAIVLLVISFIFRCAMRARKVDSNNSNYNESKPDVIQQHSSNLKLSVKGNNLNTGTPNNSTNENQTLKSICKTNELDSKEKCEVICTSNQDDFVSIEYNGIKMNQIPWENENSFKRYENSGSIYQPTIDVIAYELDCGLGNGRSLNTFNRLNSGQYGTLKNSNQTTSFYNAFNQLNLSHDDQLSNEQQLKTHFNLPSLNSKSSLQNHNVNTSLNQTNLSANINSNLCSSVSTSTTSTTTALLPLQLHSNLNGQRNLDSSLLPADSNSVNAFHRQLNSALQTHLTNSTNSSINSSTINLANLNNSLGMPINELYHPLEVQMYGNYANDAYQLQSATSGIALDNLYSPNLNDECNLDANSISIYQQQQIATHLMNSNLNNNLNSNQNQTANQQ